nr:antA/AntB antirepressor family protein [uncultured Anaerobutyricum sp.]
MENLIPVNYDSEQPTVSARDLHGALGVSKRFSAWFEVNSQGFVENEDFTSVLVSTEVQNNGGVQIRDLHDYKLSVDMAKHICLMSRTEKGKLIRQYFIDLEKAWNTPPFTKKGEHKNMNTEQIIELSRKGLELALANEEYDLTISETNAIRDCSRDKLDLITTPYYLGLQRGCVYKENCNTGYKKEIIMSNTVNKLPQEDTAKVRQKEELMQLFDSLDERRQRLVLVHIRALTGKGVTRL